LTIKNAIKDIKVYRLIVANTVGKKVGCFDVIDDIVVEFLFAFEV
jgi:hypothetical protein